MISKRWHLILFCLAAAGVLAAALGLGVSRTRAATTRFGCPPENLTVQTGQYFYFTVVISDVLDLYAWQSDFSYNTEYMELAGMIPGNMLSADGAQQHVLEPAVSGGVLEHVAITRLTQAEGVDGSSPVMYLRFRTLQDTGSGFIAVKATNALLVDRNALEIDREYINFGNCRVMIVDGGPLLIQPPIGELIFLPLVAQ